MRRYMIKFFESVNLYDEDTFNEIIKNTIFVKKRYEEIRDIVGVYFCKPNGSLKIILPEINTYQDVLIHIHEYTHAITKSEDELLPNMLEALFAMNYFNNSDILNDIASYTEEHTFAKKLKLQFLKKVSN